MKCLNARGHPAAADDPKRLIWYGPCNYWSDDWSKIGATPVPGGSMPVCPVDGAPGYQTTAQDWWWGIDRFEREGNERFGAPGPHPRYREFMEATKETCFGRGPLLKAYERWVAEHPEEVPDE